MNGAFLYDTHCNSTVNVRQVIPRDAIPSIDDPTFGPDYFGDDNDDVIVLDSTPPKAYPVRILDYHEIVNDEYNRGGTAEPVAVTWCPLCGSAIVYERTVDRQTVTFGVSGKLADDDLVMYDRETESEWKQSSGNCIAGKFAGQRLTVIPATITTWETFRNQSSDGLVLQPVDGAQSEAAGDDDTPSPIEYEKKPYAEYFASDGFGLGAHRGSSDGRTWQRDDLDPKTVVLGIEIGDDALGFPLPRVESAGGVVHETVGGTDVVVFVTSDGIHAFRNSGYAFESTTDGRFIDDGVVWNGTTGIAADGRKLSRLPARRLFAFAWQDDHDLDAFYT